METPGLTRRTLAPPLPSGFDFFTYPGHLPGFFLGNVRYFKDDIARTLMPGKRVTFDDETWASLDMLAKDRMMDFQELADEAFRDLLRKHGRPASLKEALRRSAGANADVIPLKRKTAAKKKRV